VSFGQVPVERRIGARSVAAESGVLMPSPPAASPAPAPSPSSPSPPRPH
jgi:hypothetical protein